MHGFVILTVDDDDDNLDLIDEMLSEHEIEVIPHPFRIRGDCPRWCETDEETDPKSIARGARCV